MTGHVGARDGRFENGGARVGGIIVLLAGATLVLAGCDNGPSAVAAKPPATGSRDGSGLRNGSQGDQGGGAFASSSAGRDTQDRREEPARLLDGKPIWASSKRYSAEENAQRAFERNGEAFGARNVEDFARKARAFAEHPPRGVESLQRSNGDRLLYDPKANVFAVITRDGAPRTMFKPDNGATYWEEQKTREAGRQNSGRSRSRDLSA